MSASPIHGPFTANERPPENSFNQGLTFLAELAAPESPIELQPMQPLPQGSVSNRARHPVLSHEDSSILMSDIDTNLQYDQVLAIPQGRPISSGLPPAPPTPILTPMDPVGIPILEDVQNLPIPQQRSTLSALSQTKPSTMQNLWGIVFRYLAPTVHPSKLYPQQLLVSHQQIIQRTPIASPVQTPCVGSKETTVRNDSNSRAEAEGSTTFETSIDFGVC